MPNSLLLRRDLESPFPAPQWPEGIVVAPFAAVDARACHMLLRLAYAEGGGSVSSSFDDWWQTTRTDAEFDPALVFLARTPDGSLVGMALCWTTSFVKDLVVHPDFRRRGIGEALLLTVFGVMQARGHSRIGLKVRDDNPTHARRLYERLGFLAG